MHKQYMLHALAIITFGLTHFGTLSRDRFHMPGLENITEPTYVNNFSVSHGFLSKDNNSSTAKWDVTQYNSIQCKSSRSGRNYTGTTSHSYTGQQCLPWSMFDNEAQVGDHNYCRNPDNDESGPWCYTVTHLIG